MKTLKEIYIAQWTKKEQKELMNEILEEYNENFKPIVEEWLKQKHKPIQPYTEEAKKVGYTKDEWHMREIARQCQIEELLEELKEK